MNAVSLPTQNVSGNASSAEAKAAAREKNVREAFQKFVAGTFYQQMFKSLRKMHGKPAYFHGGQAEEMFQNQMDLQVAENLAEKNGAGLSEPMYRAFAQQLRLQIQAKSQAPSAPTNPQTGSAREAGSDSVQALRL